MDANEASISPSVKEGIKIAYRRHREDFKRLQKVNTLEKAHEKR